MISAIVVDEEVGRLLFVVVDNRVLCTIVIKMRSLFGILVRSPIGCIP